MLSNCNIFKITMKKRVKNGYFRVVAFSLSIVMLAALISLVSFEVYDYHENSERFSNKVGLSPSAISKKVEYQSIYNLYTENNNLENNNLKVRKESDDKITYTNFVNGIPQDYEDIVIDQELEDSLFDGYIITLKTPSITEEKIYLEKQGGVASAQTLSQHLALIDNEQASFESKASRIAPKLKIEGKVKRVINAVFVKGEISETP